MAKLTEKEINLAEKLAQDWIKCKNSFIYFVENYCLLKDQRLGKAVPFILWDCQKELSSIWNLYDYSIILKSRQIGISWLSAAYALWCCIFHPYFIAMVLSKKEEDAKEYLEKVKFFYSNLPDFFKALAPLKTEPTQTIIEFKNESKIKVETSNPEAGRSKTLNLLIVDEGAFIPEARRIWNAAEPTLEKTKGKAIIISTANGYDPFFRPKWLSAKSGDNGFKHFFISWYGDPARTQEWYDSHLKAAKSEEREREFRQEYPANDIEAFIISGDTFYDPNLIQTYLDMKRKKPRTGNLSLVYDKILFKKAPVFEDNETGKLKIWEFPDPSKDYCGGVDTGEGGDNGDFSVFVLYDRKSKEQVMEFRARLETDEFAEMVYIIGKWYNFALLNIEINAIGNSMLNYIVKQRRYPSIYRQMKYDERSNAKVHTLGWRTTANNKRVILDALGSLLREHEMLPHSMQLFNEMKSFVRIKSDLSNNYKYEASKGENDDTIIAHALTSILFLESPLLPPHKHNVQPQAKNRLKSSGSKKFENLFK